MSRKSQERYKLRMEYFKRLRETSELVDLYVKEFTSNYIQLSDELREKVLARYRTGKPKLRPAQVRFSYELVGGKDWRKIIPACASVEVKDTSYYCADDVFDRGEKSENMYITGSLLSTIANAMLIEVAPLTSKERFQQVMQCLFRLDGDIHQGFFIDKNMHRTDLDYYMRKAYAYNYWEHILKIGALLGGATDEQIRKVAEIGKNIGIAYTIANDTCDFGKPNLEDFCSGKFTLPIIWALENTSEQEKKVLESLIGKSLDDVEKDRIRGIMVRSGAIEHGQRRSWEFCEEAIQLLQAFPPSDAREMLEFSTTMTQRNKFYDVLKRYK